MAANFWSSTHVDWLVTKQAIQDSQLEDRIRGLSDHEIQQLKVHFGQFISEIARMVKLRQRCAATAMVYFKRFYLRNSFHRHDPFIVAPSCLYLASKTEECITVAKLLVQYVKKLRPNWTHDAKDLLEYEMIIVEQLDCSLVVYSPYQSLTQLLRSSAQLKELSQNAWACLNDVYRTDLPLRYPPHMLAIGCLHLVSVMCNRDMRSWLQTLNIDINEVYDIVNEMVDMYSRYKDPISAEEAGRLLGILQQGPAGQGQQQQQAP